MKKATDILRENDPIFSSHQFSLTRPLHGNNSKTNIKRIHGREKEQYKKKKTK